MTERELVERARKAIEEFSRLPVEEQWRRMIAKGTINEKGEVLMGMEEESREEEARRNGTSASPALPEGRPGA